MDREILKKIPLFRGVSPEEAERMLGCLNAVRRRYEPEERILWAGQAAERLGAVLEGKVQIIREDEDGARTILAGAGPGELFAEAFEEQAAGRADEFAIPFTRAELADYLCVERSAMSTVLSRLRAEGLVETRGRRFRLHTHPH